MKESERALRAARSFSYNQDLQPKIEERLAKAESLLQSYLLRTGQTAVQLGGYCIALQEGELVISAAPPDGWEQTEIAWDETHTI